MPNKTRRIKDWEKFQHYKTGIHAEKKPEWIKFYPRLLQDMDWCELEDRDKAVLVDLWLLASEHGGALPCLKKICFRLRRSEKEVLAVLDRLPHWIETSIDIVYTPSIPEEEEEEDKKENKNENVESEFAENFWPAYPHKVGKPDALKSFRRQRLSHSLETILSGLSRYVSAKPPDRNWLNPSTFLNQERFLDQPATVAQAPPRQSRTVSDLESFVEEVSNGTSKPRICGEGSKLAYPQLSDTALRPENICESTDNAMRWPPTTLAQDDG